MAPTNLALVVSAMVLVAASAACGIADEPLAEDLSFEVDPYEPPPNSAPSVYATNNTAVQAVAIEPPDELGLSQPNSAVNSQERVMPRSSSSSSLPFANRFNVTRENVAGPLSKLPAGSTATTIGAMALVVGLFFLSIWVAKRGMPRSNSNLPEGVVSVLGRTQLAARQFAELIRVGNKLVLVSVTAEGREPLTEITDPAEVDRIAGLCHQTDSSSTTTEFQEALARLASERTLPEFVGADAR